MIWYDMLGMDLVLGGMVCCSEVRCVAVCCSMV